MIIIVIAIIIVIVIFTLQPRRLPASLINPGVETIPTSTPTFTPTPTLQQFKFDSSTDLKQELESINPQILDSDFE